MSAPFQLREERPSVMGVLNVTPDSFSDGGRYLEVEAAAERGAELMRQGADIVDVGGESTRPGADPVSVEEELNRVLPVVERLAAQGVPVSIDTSKPEVARQCLEAGARVVNDVTGLRDPRMVEVCAEHSCTVCLMHMLGEPRTMQQSPHYDDVVADVLAALLRLAKAAAAGGVSAEKIWIDPGIGFGKTLDHNLALLRSLGRFVESGYPVLVGVSRKSFIGKLLDGVDADHRMIGSIAAQVLAQAAGAKIIRTHDVAESVQAARTAGAILG